MSGRTVQFTRPFINGQFVPTSHAHLKHLIEPWTGNPWTQVQEASVEQVSAAIQAAKDAFEQGPWSSWTGPQRRYS
jgi:aldehyde dehydrogenase (NAD+)